MLDLTKHPHRRFNPLTREWVLVSPQRTSRPWQGQNEERQTADLSPYDPDCYLCPGNTRAGGVVNPEYESTFVFENDFPAMLPVSPSERFENGPLVAEGEQGICRVVCFSPRHDLTISEMDPADLRSVVDVWIAQYKELEALPTIKSVQIFENRGAAMGASNPHPHCQIWANASVPNEIKLECESFRDHATSNASCLLCDYLALEVVERERVVCENDDFVAVVPFWAVWPFEILLMGRRHITGLDLLSEKERDSLAEILKAVTSTYDKLFDMPFPYTMGFHQRPTDGPEYMEFHLHAHFYPPLLRSATVRKFMVGYEMLGMPQRDITAEEAASRMRAAASSGHDL